MRSSLIVLALATGILAACSDAPLPLAPKASSAPSADIESQAVPARSHIISRLGPDRCATVADGSHSAGAGLVLFDCGGSASQQFTWRSDGAMTLYDGAMCVDAAGGRGQAGDAIIIWPCKGSDNQRWHATSSGEIQGIDGPCIDVARENPNNGARLVLWDCKGSTNQLWNVKGGGSSPEVPSQPPPPADGGTLFGSYRATSPHWPHLRTMVTDFYYGIASSERDFIARHFDGAISGDRATFVGRNATGTHVPYALNWNLIFDPPHDDLMTSFYPDMKRWYAAHSQYRLEGAFIHKAGSAGDSASRVVTSTWPGERFWVLNGADEGLREYQRNRVARAAAGEDGLFFDNDGASLIDHIPYRAREYDNPQQYLTGHVAMIRAIKQGLGSKIARLNVGDMTTEFDYQMLTAAGAGHLERINVPTAERIEEIWPFLDRLLSAGVDVEMVNLYEWDESNRFTSGGFNPGNYPSRVFRMKMWELASYYMVVPSSPDHLSLALTNYWAAPPSTTWLKAQEANIGHPTEARHILARGTDPVGQPYHVWARNFDRALVLVRPTIGWQNLEWGDNTAITVTLPAGEQWLPLRGDGTLGAAVTSVRLRAAEALILVKGSKL